ncbi:MAG: MAPEG family protein [Proteobacteria bacterium]|nr:MAPEG family protein [Pseudomonadota bacterium]
MTAQVALGVELRMLAYAALLSLVLWIPYILAAIGQRGLGRVMGYPTGGYEDLPEWVQRSHRAHLNLVENLAPFAALVLIAHAIGAEGAATAFAARLFFWARLVQAAVHIAGIPWVRTLAFAAGWVGCLILFWQIVAH